MRGERLHLWWGRWSNDAGFETAYLYVHEVGDDGRVVYEGRFDEDDFESAYRELDRRYYAGEGAAFAEAGATATDWVIGFNRSDFDWIFGELTSPEVRFENRSRSVFPDRSAAQFRRKRRGARRDGRLVADLACGRILAVAAPGSSCDSTGKRLGVTASATSGSRCT